MIWFWISLLVMQSLMFCSTIPLGLWLQRRQGRFRPTAGQPSGRVSVILPIKGLDPEAESHYRHWLEQQTDMEVEVIFSLQDPQDPVLPVLERLLSTYPQTRAQILINPVRPGMNGKSSNLSHGAQVASGTYLVMADSDIDPPPDLLTRIIPPLMDPAVGLVSCLPVVRGATNFWGGVTALTFNLALTGQLAPFYLFGMGKAIGASGACVAMKPELLRAMGGFEAFGGYVAEDAEMARRVVNSGKRVVLGPAVELHQGDGSWSAFFSVLMRGAHLNLYGYPLGTLASTTIVLFGHLFILVGAGLTGERLLLEAALLAWIIRTGFGAVLQIGSDPRHGYRYAWVLPVVELTFAAAFLRALFVRTYQWRGISYRVGRGGRITTESDAR